MKTKMHAVLEGSILTLVMSLFFPSLSFRKGSKIRKLRELVFNIILFSMPGLSPIFRAHKIIVIFCYISNIYLLISPLQKIFIDREYICLIHQLEEMTKTFNCNSENRKQS